MVHIRKIILNILHQDLKGLTLEIKNHTDPTLIGIKGTITKETRSLLYIVGQTGCKKVSKIDGSFCLYRDDKSITIEGFLLEGDAKRRAKRKLRHW